MTMFGKDRAAFNFLWVLIAASLLAMAIALGWMPPGIDPSVLAVSNALLYTLTAFTYVRTRRSFSDPRQGVAIRAIMGGFMIKFFVIAAAALVYIMYQRKQVNIPGLLAAALLYMIYTTIEVRALLSLLQSKKDA